MSLGGVFFALVAAVTVLGAIGVVGSKNLVRAVMWLALTLIGTAVLYAELQAPFLAGVQVLTYVGGVATLMIFGVMVTRKHASSVAPAERASTVRGALAAIALFAVLAYAASKSGLDDLPARVAPAPTTEELALGLLDEHLVAFEAASLLLLAALVGAVVIARRNDDKPRPPNSGAPWATRDVPAPKRMQLARRGEEVTS